MKKTISVLLCLAVMFSCMSFCLAGFAASGTTYYVDSVDGSDSNSGTSPSQAWRTLVKASSQEYTSGDKILFKSGGIYTGSFTAKGDGTGENPITVSSYGDIEKEGKPIIFTRNDDMLFYIHNVNGWTIENLELIAPDGRGIVISADNDYGIMKDIAVRNCTMHNIWYHQTEEVGSNYAAVYIYSYGKHTRIENLTLSKLNIYDCAYGISMMGTTIEWHSDIFISPEESYHQNLLFEDISMNNIFYDGIIITSANNIVIRNCALINTSLNTDHYTAPMWSHHANNMLIENCEIAGATNYKDGMAVDFDGWTTNSTYQYIYSHDNIRFINNCVYDNTTKNENCTVRYCLSVNDNKADNSLAQTLNSPAYTDDDTAEYMDNFKFYNNTIINGTTFKMENLRNAYIANNIFYYDDILQGFRTKRISSDFNGTGETYLRKFTGEFTNNCFYGCAIPLAAKNSVNVDPLFAGDDFEDINSFKLSSSSKLIGKGVQAEENMGERDFFGNPLTDNHNIGCYEGPGVENEAASVNIFKSIGRFFCNLLGYAMHVILDIAEIS